MKIRSLYDVFVGLPDKRAAEGKRYHQAGVLALVTLALIAQQNSLRQIATWVDAQDPTLGSRLGFRFGRMPSYGTIRRVLLGLDLDHLRCTLQEWLQGLTRSVPVTDAPLQPLLGIAIDGKTLRGSADAAQDTPALRLLSAFVHDLGATLAQQPQPHH
jgi:DDE_Tnp_1-associated